MTRLVVRWFNGLKIQQHAMECILLFKEILPEMGGFTLIIIRMPAMMLQALALEWLDMIQTLPTMCLLILTLRRGMQIMEMY